MQVWSSAPDHQSTTAIDERSVCPPTLEKAGHTLHRHQRIRAPYIGSSVSRGLLVEETGKFPSINPIQSPKPIWIAPVPRHACFFWARLWGSLLPHGWREHRSTGKLEVYPTNETQEHMCRGQLTGWQV